MSELPNIALLLIATWFLAHQISRWAFHLLMRLLDWLTPQTLPYPTRELVQNHPGGSSAEELTVFSLSNTLIANFPAIKTVKILVEGREIQSIAGHLDLTIPYGRAPAYLQPPSERLDAPRAVSAEVFVPANVRHNRRLFQEHHEVTLTGAFVKRQVTLPKGAVVITAKQRLARVAAQLPGRTRTRVAVVIARSPTYRAFRSTGKV